MHQAVISNLYKYVIYELGESAGARRDRQRQICLLIQVIIEHTVHNGLLYFAQMYKMYKT
jgi:hypothetical protein